MTLSEWHLSATYFLFLDSLKRIANLHSFFDCGEHWIVLDPLEMGFCNPAQFPKLFWPQLVSFSSIENVVNYLSTSLLAMSLVKITLLLQNVSSPGLMESILEARWRKVCFFDKFLLEESFLGELVGELGLLEKIILHPPHYWFLR